MGWSGLQKESDILYDLSYIKSDFQAILKNVISKEKTFQFIFKSISLMNLLPNNTLSNNIQIRQNIGETFR